MKHMRISEKKKTKNKKQKTTSALLTILKFLTVWITTYCGKSLEMVIPDPLTCHPVNLYVGQEATVITGHGITNWFIFGKKSMSRLYTVTVLI